jgi:hypothetical protein
VTFQFPFVVVVTVARLQIVTGKVFARLVATLSFEMIAVVSGRLLLASAVAGIVDARKLFVIVIVVISSTVSSVAAVVVFERQSVASFFVVAIVASVFVAVKDSPRFSGVGDRRTKRRFFVAESVDLFRLPRRPRVIGGVTVAVPAIWRVRQILE